MSPFGGGGGSTTNVAGFAINELSRRLGLGVFRFQGKGQTAERNRKLAGATARASGFPKALARNSLVRFLPQIQADVSSQVEIANKNPLSRFKPESTKGLGSRQLSSAIRRNRVAKAAFVLNARQFKAGVKGGRGTGQPVVTNPVNTKDITREVFNKFIASGVNAFRPTAAEAVASGRTPSRPKTAATSLVTSGKSRTTSSSREGSLVTGPGGLSTKANTRKKTLLG